MPRKSPKPNERDPNDIHSDQFRPATSIENRENQMIALAVDLAEQQLRDGTASAQVITHYLKLGSTKERLEKKNLEKDIELKSAKTEAIQSAKQIEELYRNAIDAMRSYSGALTGDTAEDPNIF